MSSLTLALVVIAILLLLLAARIPIGVALLLCGVGGYAALAGWGPLLAYLKTGPYWRFASHDLSVVPMFLLMGQFASKADLSRDLFASARVWFGGLRGGMAMASIGACAGFGAVCGSSLATAATMGQVALPELRRNGYAPGFATGVLAAGGTLGILIPPSVILVIYAILVEGNIAVLFQAAFIPGLLAVIGYLLAIAVVGRLRPGKTPNEEGSRLIDKLRSLRAVWPVIAIFSLVIGGLYAGVFTPTEGAAVGACATGLLAWLRKRLALKDLLDCLVETAMTTAMIFLILLGADLFSAFLGLSRMPVIAAQAIADSELSPYLILLVMLFAYLIMGCVMESLSMIVLTIPVFWPVISGLDFGLGPEELKLWFGIIALVIVEIGLITPPLGLNIFVIHGLARDVPMAECFKGVSPFLVSDLIRIALLVGLPALTLWAPRLLG